MPVLLVQGETDRQVTPEQADTLAQAIRSGGNTKVSVRRLPAVNHLLVDDPRGWSSGYRSLPSKSISRAVLTVVVDWLAEHLQREAA